MTIDLHLHSNFSDGTLAPSELIDLAISSKLSVIALTDHDTLQGLAQAEEAAKLARQKGYDITLVPGVEISVHYKGNDIHILGLFIDASNPTLIDALNSANEKRNLRNEKIAGIFRNDGISITVGQLQEDAKDAVITRAHFANHLTKHGYAKSIADAFDRFLGKDSPYYVAREYLQPKKGIDLIHGAGGLAFIAHPLLYGLSKVQIIEMIKDFKEMGLDGVEAIYSSNTNEEEDFLINLTKNNDLLITGGSDFHGETKPGLKMGVGRGNMLIPYSIYEEMLNSKNNK